MITTSLIITLMWVTLSGHRDALFVPELFSYGENERASYCGSAGAAAGLVPVSNESCVGMKMVVTLY